MPYLKVSVKNITKPKSHVLIVYRVRSCFIVRFSTLVNNSDDIKFWKRKNINNIPDTELRNGTKHIKQNVLSVSFSSESIAQNRIIANTPTSKQKPCITNEAISRLKTVCPVGSTVSAMKSNLIAIINYHVQIMIMMMMVVDEVK